MLSDGGWIDKNRQNYVFTNQSDHSVGRPARPNAEIYKTNPDIDLNT
jgi:hypothetical protein